jgi:hypothetical protein
MGKVSRLKLESPQAKANSRGCVYYIHTEQGYVGTVASREQARALDEHSVLVCDENEVAQFPEWGNERANQYVFNKALTLGFSRIGNSAFFERTTQGSGYVYFIEAVGLSRVKIGYSEDPESRLKQLLTGSPVTLKIFAKMPGNQPMEKEIHARFLHLKVENEWFHFTDEIKTYVENNCI